MTAALEASRRLVRRLHWTSLAAGAVILTYIVLTSWLSILRYHGFQAHAFDLGNMNQALWNTVHGEPFRFTNRGIDWWGPSTRLAAHFEPVLLLLAPVYALAPRVETLLVLQSAALGLAGIPAYLMATAGLGSPVAGLLFLAAFLAVPSLHALNFYDFHLVALAVPALMAALHALERGRVRTYAAFILLALACKENVGIPVAALGLYLLAVGRPVRLGLATSAVGAGWILLALFVLIPHYNPAGTSSYWFRYSHLGDGPTDILRNAWRDPTLSYRHLTTPPQPQNLTRLFLSSGFLSWADPLRLAVALPSILEAALSRNTVQAGFGHHYGALIIPFLYWSAVGGAGRLQRWLGGGRWTAPALGGLVLAGALLGAATTRSVPSRIFDAEPGQYAYVAPALWNELLALTGRRPSQFRTPRTVWLREQLSATVDPAASLSASAFLNPHLSSRRSLYLFPDLQDADWVAIDLERLTLEDQAAIRDRALAWTVEGRFGVILDEDGLLILGPAAGP